MWSQDYIRSELVVHRRSTYKRGGRQTVIQKMRAHIDPTSACIGLKSNLLILAHPLVVLLDDHFVFRDVSVYRLGASLTQLGHLSKTPVCLVVKVLDSLALFKQGRADLMPWEHILVVCLVRVQILLERKLEARFKEVCLHLSRCMVLKCVRISTSSLSLNLDFC